MENPNEKENLTPTEETIPDPVTQLEALKANSVTKDEYERIVLERNKLFEQLTKMPTTTTVPTAAPKVDKDALRKDLYSEHCNLSNLDYWKKTLELRKAIIEEGGEDPFLPNSSKGAAAQDEIDSANRVADVVSQCIERADGNSAIFTAELQRRTNDSARVPGRR